MLRFTLHAGPLAAQEICKSERITIIVPLPANSTAYAFTLLLADALKESIGKVVLAEARPGALGLTGAKAIIAAKPDGCTWLLAPNSVLAGIPAVAKAPPYDPTDEVKTFTPVGYLGNFRMSIVVSANHPKATLRTMSDLTAFVRRGNVSYGFGNLMGQVCAQELSRAIGADMLGVEYKQGEGQALPDLQTGRLDVMCAIMTTSLGQVKSGVLRALAVTGKYRSSELPHVPTLAEAGLQPLGIEPMLGLVGPPNLESQVARAFSEKVGEALLKPNVLTRLQAMGIEPAPGTPEELASFIKEELARWNTLVREGRIKQLDLK